MLCIECWLAEVIDMPFGVDCSSGNGVVESARLIMHPVSAAIVWFELRRGLVDVACFS